MSESIFRRERERGRKEKEEERACFHLFLTLLPLCGVDTSSHPTSSSEWRWRLLLRPILLPSLFLFRSSLIQSFSFSFPFVIWPLLIVLSFPQFLLGGTPFLENEGMSQDSVDDGKGRRFPYGLMKIAPCACDIYSNSKYVHIRKWWSVIHFFDFVFFRLFYNWQLSMEMERLWIFSCAMEPTSMKKMSEITVMRNEKLRDRVKWK